MLDISQFSLVWADEFDTLSLADAAGTGARWCTKGITPAFGNQKFMPAASGVFNIVQKGDSASVLEIKMRRNATGGLESGLICNVFPDQSSVIGSPTPVGYTEIRAWMPDAIPGIWPAIWAMGMGRFDPARTRTPECDLIEWYGPVFPDRYSTHMHNWHDTGSTNDDLWCRNIVGAGVLQGGFHLYGLEIGEDRRQTYYFDRVPYFSVDPATYDPPIADTIGTKPLAWMINFAAGAGWPIDPELGAAKPASLWVDYIRGYSRTITPEQAIAAQIADLNAQITSLKAQITALNARVASRDKSITQLNGQINTLQAQIAALNTAAATFKTTLSADAAAIAAALATLQQHLA